MKEAITSEYLSASAGSGKTYALSNRFCRLVMAGVSPDEICALTFTRPATREIFSAIIKRLVKNEVPLVAGGLSREQALQRILDVLPRLQISTIDAFSAKIARLFAYEVGLSPDFALYDNGNSPDSRALLHETVRQAFMSAGGAAAKELLTVFDIEDSASADNTPLIVRWKSFLQRYGAIFDVHPKGWGDLEAIDTLLPKRCANVPELCQKALDAITALETTGNVDKRAIKKLRTLLREYQAETTSVRQLKFLWGGDWKGQVTLRECAVNGRFEYHSKDISVGDVLQTIFLSLNEDLLARDLEQTAQHTRRLYHALKLLKASEKALTTESGLISFDCLTRILSTAVNGRLSVLNPDAFYVAYRLDSEIRHLMIDEFQDTSTAQWDVLSGVAHELTTSEDGTFFYVGDVKQSIYAWRGGDPTLFADPTRLPNLPAGAPLVHSYRSVKPIIDLVNLVMQFKLDACPIGCQSWQLEMLTQWNQRWQNHVSNQTADGYVQMLALEGTRDVWIVNAARLIAARWRQLSKKKLSMAVLATTNSLLQGEKGLIKYLRQEGVPCAVDGKRNVSETPMGALIIQLLHWMADPRATLWCSIAERLGIAEHMNHETLSTWLTDVSRGGFTTWLDILFGESSSLYDSLTDMDKNVLDAVREGLEVLDRQGKIEPSEARETLKVLQVSCAADEHVLNLMTVHHSKGLTFDVVFSLFSGKINDERNVGYEIGNDWVLERPTLNETYNRIPELQVARQIRREARMYDTLCMLYVAITRARYEQIILAPITDVTSLSSVPGWLYQKFSIETATACSGIADSMCNEGEVTGVFDCYNDGCSSWWESQPQQDCVTQNAVVSELNWQYDVTAGNVEVGLPSEQSKAKTIFDLLETQGAKAKRFGISLHNRLSNIEWYEASVDGIFPEVFTRPVNEQCELWRERPFSVQIVKEGTLQYVAGQFDRVHIFPDRQSAIIYDFKTSRVAEITQPYRSQMLDYKKALAALLGYKEANIRTQLLFTRHQKVVEVAE